MVFNYQTEECQGQYMEPDSFVVDFTVRKSLQKVSWKEKLGMETRHHSFQRVRPPRLLGDSQQWKRLTEATDIVVNKGDQPESRCTSTRDSNDFAVNAKKQMTANLLFKKGYQAKRKRAKSASKMSLRSIGSRISTGHTTTSLSSNSKATLSVPRKLSKKFRCDNISNFSASKSLSPKAPNESIEATVPSSTSNLAAAIIEQKEQCLKTPVTKKRKADLMLSRQRTSFKADSSLLPRRSERAKKVPRHMHNFVIGVKRRDDSPSLCDNSSGVTNLSEKAESTKSSPKLFSAAIQEHELDVRMLKRKNSESCILDDRKTVKIGHEATSVPLKRKKLKADIIESKCKDKDNTKMECVTSTHAHVRVPTSEYSFTDLDISPQRPLERRHSVPSIGDLKVTSSHGDSQITSNSQAQTSNPFEIHGQDLQQNDQFEIEQPSSDDEISFKINPEKNLSSLSGE